MTQHNDQEQRRYMAAAHAVQSGVAMELNDNPPSNSASPASPKMLRVGINMAMIEHGALVRMLIAKGIFTEAEYFAELTSGVEDEQRQYEEHPGAGLLAELAAARAVVEVAIALGNRADADNWKRLYAAIDAYRDRGER